MAITFRLFRPLGAALSSWFMPALCVHCRRDRWGGTPLCLGCLRKAAPLRGPVCGTCGLPACGGTHENADDAFTSLRFLFRIGPQVSTLIHGFKYRHMLRHIRFLCAYLRYRPDIAEWARSFDLLVPVPIHAVRRRERGYNQAERIALEAAKYLGLPVLASALIRVRATGSQTKLNRLQRGSNLEKAFVCKSPESVRGKRILIVDDVFTTGATVRRCAELLKAAGAADVGILALARVETAADQDDFALEMEAVSSYAS
ncbi:MAG: amidophosphoribosyltransferase [Fibrobacteres bacterium]|nr:amidophosphoribosyltransferase [Fibrobacterota bacterium]